MIFKVHALPTSFKPSSIYKSYQSFSSSVAKCPCHSIATAQNLRTPSLVLVPSIDDVTIEDDTNFFDIC